ncbi:MAG: exopolysaccharide Pel transporter PelG [Spirochaetales bacterium]|nr:exopolysaccharide Pel transporter PelG [Spirochaetales bacterium]
MSDHKLQPHAMDLKTEHFNSRVSSYNPWLIIFMCYSFLGIICFLLPDDITHGFTRITLFYALLGSLFITAPFYFVFIRFLNEKLKILSNVDRSGIFLILIISIFTLAVIGAVVFMFFSDASVVFNLSVIILFILLSLNWLLLLFLSISRQFLLIAACYFIAIIGILLVGTGVELFAGEIGLINVLNLGIGAVFFILWYLVSEKIKITYTVKLDFFSFVKQKPYYLIFGLIVILGIFIDKIVIWSSDLSKIYAHVFVSFSAYETSVAMAFLTAIPPVIYFVLNVEKRIHVKSKKLYESINLGSQLNIIENNQRELTEYILKAFFNILKIQVTTVFSVNYLATQIFSLFKLPLENVILFRTALWGVACFVLFSFIVTILLNWDFKGSVLFLSLLFLVINMITSYIASHLDQRYTTYGFSFTCLIVLLAALIILVYTIKNLIYIVFKNPPIAYKAKIIKGKRIGNYLIKNGKRV